MADTYNQFNNPTYESSATVVTEPPNNDTIIDQHAGSKGMYTEKTRSSIKIQGSIQIAMGLICVISQSVVIYWALHLYSCIWSQIFWLYHREPVPSEAAGIWCGAMFLVTGSIGVLSSYKNTRNWVMAYMICSIISACLVFVVIGLAFLNISDVNKLFCTTQNKIAYAFDGLMVAAAGIEFVVSVWSTVLSCDARYGCCAIPQSNSQQQYNVMYNERGSTPDMHINHSTAPAAPVNMPPVNVTEQVSGQAEMKIPV